MRVLACVALALVIAGCGKHRVQSVSSAPQSAPTSSTGAAVPPAGSTGEAGAPATKRDGAKRAPADSLEIFMRKVRALSAEARPERVPATTLESLRPRLAAAAAAATFAPSPETLRAAAAEYARAGVNDRAFEYLNRSIALAPRDAASYDALARLWRDSGFPQLGLGDAYRAVYYAPESSIARNTLGTLLQSLGHRDAARREYQRALGLEPTAVYALNNLCYGWVVEGEGRHAVAACEKALSLDPDFAPARHNLALAFAVVGDVSAARRTFDASSDRAQALYNVGIMHLARREYREAIKAFEEAKALRPGMHLATARLRQSQAAIERGANE